MSPSATAGFPEILWSLLLISGIVSPKPCWFPKTACLLAPFQHVNIFIEDFPIWQLPRQSFPGVLVVSLQKDQATESVTPAYGLHGK